MIELIHVLTGEVKASKEHVIFKSSAIGSCVVIAAFDLNLRISAMAHVMLPGISPEKSKYPKTRYALNAIDDMMDKMIQLGANKTHIEVCLVGGSNVLKRPDDTICQANINSVINILTEKNIKIRAKSIGGTQRRSVTFNTKSGTIHHSIGDEKYLLLNCF